MAEKGENLKYKGGKYYLGSKAVSYSALMSRGYSKEQCDRARAQSSFAASEKIPEQKFEEKVEEEEFGIGGEIHPLGEELREFMAQEEARAAFTPAHADRDPLAEGIPSAIHALLASKQGRLDTQELMSMGVDDMIAKAQEGIARNSEANSELEQNILHAYGHMNPGLIAARRINYPETNLHWQAPDHVSMGENVGPEGQRFSLNIAGYTNPVGKVAMENMPHLYDPYEQYRGVFGRRREGTSHRLRDFVNQAPVTRPGRPAPVSALEQNMALLDTQQLYEKMQKRAGNGDSLTRMIRGMPIGKLKARN